MMSAEEIIGAVSRLQPRYARYHQHCLEIARLMLPNQAVLFNGTVMNEGDRRMHRIIDSEAMYALQDGCSVIEGYTMPKGTSWQRLVPRDRDLLKTKRVAAWYELKTAQLFAMREDPESGFANQSHHSVESLLAFGMQSMFVDIRRVNGVPVGMVYRSEHIGQIFIDENFQGMPYRSFRKFKLTARQALQQWPDNPPPCAAALKNMDAKLDTSHEYIHAIIPRERFDPERLDANGMPYASIYLSCADKMIIEEGGYRAKRRIPSRWDIGSEEITGRSRAMMCLPDVKALQQGFADMMTAVERSARPTLLAHDDMLDQLINYVAGDVIYGGLDDQMNPTLRPMLEGIDITPISTLVSLLRDNVRRAFYGDLLDARDELKSHVTATAVMERKAAQGILLSPLNRQEGEWFAPLLAAELDIMAQMGLLDDMPPEVKEAGGAYDVVYQNPLSQSRDANDAAAILQLEQAVQGMAAVDPDAPKIYAARYPTEQRILRLAAAFGVPVDLQADEAAAAATQADQADAAQTEQLLAAAPVLSDVASQLGSQGAMIDAFAA